MAMARPWSAVSKERIELRRMTKPAKRTRQAKRRSSAVTTAKTIRRLMENAAPILFLQHISVAPEGMDDLRAASPLQLPPQTRDIDLDDVAEALPIEIIKMLKQLRLGHDRAVTMGEVFDDAVLHPGERNKLRVADHGAICSIDFDVADSQGGRTATIAATDERF